jgi:AcrR family transcriptional regulator
MNDVAAEVGLTKGGIYHHISKKEDLLTAIHEEMANALLEKLATIDKEKEPYEQLAMWIEIHAKIMKNYQRHIKIFFTELDNLSKTSFKRIVLKRDRVKTILHSIIKDGINKKQFDKNLDSNIVSLLIIGMLNWFYQWYQPNGKLSIEEIIENVKKLVFLGILKPNVTKEI